MPSEFVNMKFYPLWRVYWHST